MVRDEFFMRRAIALARLGEGWTNPNPLVGAVIVRDGKIIGEGFHHRRGLLHAERDAIEDMKNRGENGKGATIYVTLEPCCHFGKQPPCTLAIVENGIRKVVVGSRDPNPLVHGKGNQYLRKNGIEVVEDFLIDECDALNQIFFKFITTEKPFVALKYAMTADGKIATKTGSSKWITGEVARGFVHELRNRYSAIVAGIGTVFADDPLLNCRLLENTLGQEQNLAADNFPQSSVDIYGNSNPLRVICDKSLRLPLKCQIAETAAEIPTIVAAGKDSVANQGFDGQEKIAALEKLGVEVMLLPESGEGVDLNALVTELGKRKIDSVLVEGGGQLNYSFLERGLVDKIYAFVSPKFFGGDKALGPVRGKGIDFAGDAFEYEVREIKVLGKDILIEMDLPVKSE